MVVELAVGFPAEVSGFLCGGSETKEPDADLTGQASFEWCSREVLLNRSEDAVLASFHEFVLRKLAILVRIVVLAAFLDRR